MKKSLKKNTKKKSYKKDKTYKKLIDMKIKGKKLSKYQERKLKKTLGKKYCKCIKTLSYGKQNPGAYGICRKSIYKNRGFDVPNINCRKKK
tara:strand:+ start:81 stop:353 length:273 start_codon:yes stop_codon:yes gene_type:complete